MVGWLDLTLACLALKCFGCRYEEREFLPGGERGYIDRSLAPSSNGMASRFGTGGERGPIRDEEGEKNECLFYCIYRYEDVNVGYR